MNAGPPDCPQPHKLGHFKKKSIQTMAAAIKSPTGVDHHCFESHRWYEFHAAVILSFRKTSAVCI